LSILAPTQCHIKQLSGIKLSEREADHFHLVKNVRNFTSTPSMRFHGVTLKHTVTLPLPFLLRSIENVYLINVKLGRLTSFNTINYPE
jgi:hypothetical protein